MTLPPPDPGFSCAVTAGLMVLGGFLAIWAFIIYECAQELRGHVARWRANRRKP